MLWNASFREIVVDRAVVRRHRVRRERDLDRWTDREVGDLHHRAVVDGEHQSVADAERVIELLDDERGAVAGEDGDLRGARWRGRHRRELRPGIAGDEVGALLVLQRVRVHAGRDAVVVDAGVDSLEVPDVEPDEAAEARVVVGLAVRAVDRELRARRPLAGGGANVVTARVDRVDDARPARCRRGEVIDEAAPRTRLVGVPTGHDRYGRSALEIAAGPGTGVERLDPDDLGKHRVDGRVDGDADRRAGHDDPADELVCVDRSAAVEILVGRRRGDQRSRAGRRVLEVREGDLLSSGCGGRIGLSRDQGAAGGKGPGIRRGLGMPPLGADAANVDRDARESQQHDDEDGEDDEHLPARLGAAHQLTTIVVDCLLDEAPVRVVGQECAHERHDDVGSVRQPDLDEAPDRVVRRTVRAGRRARARRRCHRGAQGHGHVAVHPAVVIPVAVQVGPGGAGIGHREVRRARRQDPERLERGVERRGAARDVIRRPSGSDVEPSDRRRPCRLAGRVREGDVRAEQEPELDDAHHDQEHGQQDGGELDHRLAVHGAAGAGRRPSIGERPSKRIDHRVMRALERGSGRAAAPILWTAQGRRYRSLGAAGVGPMDGG